jgi:iron(III) transport system ATP-binding protein
MLEVRNISLNYGREVLKDISLQLKQGEIISIVGKSGAGKTSLLKIMAGNLEPTSGEVWFEGVKVKGPITKLIPGHPEVCLVNQDFQLDKYHTTEENIKNPILYLPEKERNIFLEELIELLELGSVRNQQAISLSGGEQQRLAIARVIAMEPKVILLDEPFSHLDGLLRKKLINYFLELRRIRKTSLVLVSHDGTEVLGLSDRIYSMKNGVITRKGNPHKFYYKPKSLEDARLFGPMNSIRVGDKRVFFRPDEFTLNPQKDQTKVELSFLYSSFTGPVYENFFQTNQGEQVVLFSFNSLENVTKIGIEHKN